MKRLNQPLISCIIPVYNAEEYLIQGIESLLAQTYKNLEIILIDDQSTDESWRICRKYEDKYNNINAYRLTSNSGGPLRGREMGIRKSRGEWITFMDCDDFVGPMYIEHLVETTDNGKYDIAVTGHSRLHQDGRIEDFQWKNYSQTTNDRLRSFFTHYFLEQDYWTDPADTVGQNLIRASVAKKTDLSKYPGNVYGEDSLMALSFLENTTKGINFVDYHDFIWRQRPGSGSHGGFSETADRQSLYNALNSIFSRTNTSPLVSIIVPIFNVENFLKSCIDSILSQSYLNIELILVNDNTPDRSGEIADSYVGKDDRIRVIHKKKNEGLNMARATGFEASTGEFVMFVDSDDLLVEDCIETALRELLKDKTDFVRFGMLTFKDENDLNQKLTNPPSDRKVVLKSKKELYLSQFDQYKILGDLPMFSMTVCGAIYPRKYVEKIDWDDTNYRVYEDNIWTLRYMENISCGTYVSHIGYLYRFDDTITNVLNKSLTGNSYNGKPIGYIECWKYIWDEYRRYNRKYNIGADKVVEDMIRHLYLFRADHLTKANLWNAENNIDYLPEALKLCQDARIEGLATINTLESENTQLKVQLNALQAELDTHFSIRRSTKLTLGNIKRRFQQKKYWSK